MSRRAANRPLTTTEQALRWTGLGLILLAITVGVIQPPGGYPLIPLLILTAVGCWVAMLMVGRAQNVRSDGQEPTAGTGSDDRRNIDTAR